MCTVSWLRSADGYVLFCNRDERLTRQPAQGPELRTSRGVSFVAPVDGDHGGSWIGVNEFGLTLCLLNRYGLSAPDPGRTYTSRGLLLTDLLVAEAPQHLEARLGKVSLDSFQPFTLLAVHPNKAALIIEWTGLESEIRWEAEGTVPLSSTSLREPGIAISRREYFQSLREADVEMLGEFHRSHFPERGPYSVCMHREDARTVSMSKVTVDRHEIEFAYHPTSPCIKAEADTVKMMRRSGTEHPLSAAKVSEAAFRTTFKA